MENVHISFTDGTSSLAVPRGSDLAEVLDRPEVPVFFGCKTGNCGTCLVEVADPTGLPEPSDDEREWLETLAPGNRNARLACQLKAFGDLTLRAL